MARRPHRPKGTWMKLRSTDILVAIMKDKNFSMQRLATYAGCSKGFIGFLAKGQKTSCTPALADRISEALGVPTLVLFEERASAVSGRNAKTERKVA